MKISNGCKNSLRIVAPKSFETFFQNKCWKVIQFITVVLFFYLMTKIIIRTTNKATQKLIERIRNLDISKIRGENISQVTSLICGAVTRLGDKIPSDITDILLRVYQTMLYVQLNRLFEQMEVNMKINNGSKYTM